MFKLLKTIIEKLDSLIISFKELKATIKDNEMDCMQYHSQQCANCIHRNNNTFYDNSIVLGPNTNENLNRNMEKDMKDFLKNTKRNTIICNENRITRR